MATRPDLDRIMRGLARRTAIRAALPKVGGLPDIEWAYWRVWKSGYVKMATYHWTRRVIRVNSQLRRAPDFVLRHVVYHELIHHVLGSEVETHGAEFERLEKRCPDYKVCEAWISGWMTAQPRR